MRNMPYRVVNEAHPWSMTSGPLPVLLHGSDVAGAARVAWKVAHTSAALGGEELASATADGKLLPPSAGLDAGLSADSLAHVVAFSALVDGVLGDVLVRALNGTPLPRAPHAQPAPTALLQVRPG